MEFVCQLVSPLTVLYFNRESGKGIDARTSAPTYTHNHTYSHTHTHTHARARAREKRRRRRNIATRIFHIQFNVTNIDYNSAMNRRNPTQGEITFALLNQEG